MSASPPPPHAPWLAAARTLLHTLAGPHGIHASASSTANYRAVFARDAVMAGAAGLAVGDGVVVAGLVRTLERLRALQGAEGQIASNYEPRGDAPPRVSFGTIVPRIDAATWYLVGVGLAARAGALDPAPFRDSVRRVVRLLDALEYNGRHLIYVPAGGNWADEYVYEGYILYDQVLRAWGVRLAATVLDDATLASKATHVEQAIVERFWPAGDGARTHPLASFTPLGARDTFDLAACSLLGAAGLAPALAGPTLGWIVRRFVARGALPPAFYPVIDEAHPDWPALRRYHLYDFRNRPHEYHNGGVWPIWLGWLGVALARAGRTSDLAALRAAVATRLAAIPDFDFPEYLHGVTGAAGGTTGMAYTATGLVLLDAADAPATLALLAE